MFSLQSVICVSGPTGLQPWATTVSTSTLPLRAAPTMPEVWTSPSRKRAFGAGEQRLRTGGKGVGEQDELWLLAPLCADEPLPGVRRAIEVRQRAAVEVKWTHHDVREAGGGEGHGREPLDLLAAPDHTTRRAAEERFGTKSFPQALVQPLIKLREVRRDEDDGERYRTGTQSLSNARHALDQGIFEDSLAGYGRRPLHFSTSALTQRLPTFIPLYIARRARRWSRDEKSTLPSAAGKKRPEKRATPTQKARATSRLSRRPVGGGTLPHLPRPRARRMAVASVLEKSQPR